MDNDFAKRLAQILHHLQIPKSNLALNLDVSPSAVTGWLNGKKPVLAHLINISRTLNISLDWLITGKGPVYLHGPLHLSSHEETVLLLLRNLPEGSIDTLVNLLSGLTNSSSDTALIQQAKMAKTMHSADVAMIMLDNNKHIVDINRAYLKMLNLEPCGKERVVGSSFLDWVLGDKAELLMQFNQVKDNDTPVNLIVQHIRYNDTRPVNAYVSGIHRSYHDGAFFLLTAFYLPKT